MDTPLYVGIDVGKRKHVAVVISTALLKKHKHLKACPATSFENSRTGFVALWTWLCAHGTDYHVLLERTGHYSASLLQFLSETGACILYLAHPQKRRPADKDDRRDARTLAQSLYSQVALGLPVTESQLLARPYVQPSETARRCVGLVQHREELIGALVRCKNRLIAINDELFPELTQVYPNPNSPIALTMREALPTPAAVVAASIEQLCTYTTRRNTWPSREALVQLQELARHTIGCKDAHRVQSLVLEQSQLITMQRLILAQIDHLEEQLDQALAASREGSILRSMGLGVIQSATLLSGIGSIANFESAGHLRGYLGWRPRAEQTGTTLDIVALTRGGTRPLKRTMYLIALRAVQREPWKSLYLRLVPLKARYDSRVGRYRGKMKIIGRVAGQFIGVMYTLLRKDYDVLAALPAGVEPPPPTLYNADKHAAAMASAAGRRVDQHSSEVEGRAEQERHDTPPILPPSAQAE